MKLLRFNHYYIKEPKAPKIIFSLDFYTVEDRWHLLYTRQFPLWNPIVIQRKQEFNNNRYNWLVIGLNICGLHLNFEIRLKKVGNLYYGRTIK